MTTFNPDGLAADKAICHAKQLDLLVIVDDGSENHSAIENIVAENIHVICLKNNSGIAKALNTGILFAQKNHADYILTLDQDSDLTENFVSSLHNLFSSSSAASKIGIVLPDCINGIPSIPPRYAPEGFGLVDEGIQSGMMISNECLQDIGLFDEDLFIDCVDTDFCLRARSADWNIGVATSSNIIHSLGKEIPKRRMFGVNKSFQYHSPFRRYYITRNNLDLIFKNLKKRPRWVLSVIRREWKPLLNHILWGPDRFNALIATSAGAAHGVLRRRGKIPTWLIKLISN